MEGGSNLEAVPEEDLVVIPRPQQAPGPSSKRAFQKRRRSRACDACRLRKTKCDAPPEGTCSSCTSASLLCKFTEADNEKKKFGPARRLRMLETTVQELNEKLKIAEAKLQSGDRSGDSSNTGLQNSSSDSHSTLITRGDDSPTTSTTTTGQSPSDRSPRHSISQPLRRFSYDGSTSDDLFIGTTSGLGFLASVQEYVERLGYDTTPLLDAWKNSEAKAFPTNTASYSEGSQLRDLRALLPPKASGKKLLDIFHYNTARCVPIVYWPIILNKFERAYEAPIFPNDQMNVTSIFCVLMAIYAVASICSDDLDVFEPPNYNSKRGWHFFECAKKFHDLNQPMYTLADAEVLLILSMYLDIAALPSPTWMTVGCLARVCQDLGLHRKPSDGKFTPAEYEHRSRIFWCTFMMDRKLALQFGRPPILNEEEIDMDEPGKNDTSDLINATFENAPAGTNTFSSVSLLQKLIANARFIDPILRLNVEPGNEIQIEYRINEIEEKLDMIEKGFPEGILDWENSGPIEPVLLKYAMMAMATRLAMYRYFTYASLDRRLRTRCFIRSVEVGKSTVHLLHRIMQHPDWERGFRLHQSELSYQHTFKISIILLLAATIFTKPFQVATSSELHTCIKALQAAAVSRPTVEQSLHLFDQVAKILKNEQVPTNYGSSIPMNASPGSLNFNNVEYNTSPTSFVSVGSASIGSTASSASSIITSSLPNDPKSLYIPPVVPSNDMRGDNTIVPKFWPNYESYGRAALGFSNMKVPSPNENTAWLNQVDPSYWTLMENVLSNEANINERR
ncbi:hypothetical protein H072_10331 [Dactylellina haptotyla CBS 200.50]|uniref:Zn(2)-C6 fungal-type domain-containing protein n=1 Tax=Dactylellina haptotyla (strain CBS 200.50) TaxID=1284197 RepID=S8BAU7_DACHA|nr:hypothetical protein H072_10331 [Dactylellina haptotyla CBS 200.50]